MAKVRDRSHPAAVSAIPSATDAAGSWSLLAMLDRWYYLSNSSLRGRHADQSCIEQ